MTARWRAFFWLPVVAVGSSSATNFTSSTGLSTRTNSTSLSPSSPSSRWNVGSQIAYGMPGISSDASSASPSTSSLSASSSVSHPSFEYLAVGQSADSSTAIAETTETLIESGTFYTVTASGSDILEDGQYLTADASLTLTLDSAGLVYESTFSGSLIAVSTTPEYPAQCRAAGAAPPSTPADYTLRTGSGSAYASSCSQALWDWESSSSNWSSLCATSTVVNATYTSLWSVYWQYQPTPTGASLSQITTLCDHFPRVVGTQQPPPQPTNTTTITTTYYDQLTTSALPEFAPYTTPVPCSINPSDCAALWSSFNSISANVELSPYYVNEPPCTTAAANSTSAGNATSDPPFVVFRPPNLQGFAVYAEAARLLYWPARALNETAYFCATVDPFAFGSGNTTPSAVPFYPPVSGAPPPVFISESLTLTSPTVALSIAGLQRSDGYGPTISTIIPYDINSLSTVRGAQAYFDLFPINLPDFNFRCAAADGTYTLAAVAGDDCYQDVPAQAYFLGLNNFDQWEFDAGNNETSTLTIYQDYRPYIQPPDDISSLVESLWGPSAFFGIDGVWDPPSVLTAANSVAGITLPSAAWSTATSTEDPIITTPASPAQSAIPITQPATQPPSTLVQTATTSADAAGTIGASIVSSHSSNQDPASDPTGSPSSSAADTSNASDPATATPTTITIGSSALQAHWSGSNLIVGSHTLAVSGPAITIAGQTVSAASTGLVVADGASTTTIPIARPSAQANIVTIGSSAVAVHASSSDAIVVGSQTLTVGGPGATVNGQSVSAGHGGLVVIGTGGTAQTVPVAGLIEGQDVVIGSATLDAWSSGPDFVVGGSRTVTIDGAAATVAGEIVSAASAGLVVGTGPAAETVSVTALAGAEGTAEGGASTFESRTGLGSGAVSTMTSGTTTSGMTTSGTTSSGMTTSGTTTHDAAHATSTSAAGGTRYGFGWAGLVAFAFVSVVALL